MDNTSFPNPSLKACRVRTPEAGQQSASRDGARKREPIVSIATQSEFSHVGPVQIRNSPDISDPSSRLAGLRLSRRLERIKSRTTAECLMKRRTEVAQAAVTDFERGLGHITLPGAQQFGGALHTNLPEMLLDG